MKDIENNFNMISGTNGIMGAVDTVFMIDKNLVKIEMQHYILLGVMFKKATL